MTGMAQAARPFQLMVDCLAPVSASAAEALVHAGYRLFGRYLETLSARERDMIHGTGAGIVPITEARLGALSAARGHEVGSESVTRAMALGVPPRVHITIDSEETGPSSKFDVIAYDNTFAETLDRYGYGAMLYVGAGQPLQSSELYELTAWPYWRGGSLGIPEPSHCGWSVVQAYPLEQELGDLCPGYPMTAPDARQKFDVSFLACDFHMRTPVVWMP